ncbi:MULTISPECIES: tetratricopeptide repeat protein [unclassified Granulicatella]|uniref:tetratricopeptide repeat protein n=1 Tax=unclassified Granulicatella TaxID=2630493 RepID=UPI00107493A0|nr:MULTISPECIES: tetratricopeptide repeat protein [unclassified Granulicatella]MBF0779666.1 tetratricopeptide repeat protein [Granulicatella sp. 19428wC4_WM01]TFU96321.1 tetratricopeptide repeat protein [Granulicatella sp. WM01]
MKELIKKYWNNLKLEYKNKYGELILTSYETSKPFVEKFKVYLEKNLKEDPCNVDIVCALATIMQELADNLDSVKLLEDFIKTYEEKLSDTNKARIYTNLAFYNAKCKEEIQYLLEAEKLKSPFIETYKGLGLSYFSKYQFDKNTANLEKSLIVFEKALEINNDNYEMMFGYGVCLFEFKRFKEAKEVFEKLLIKYPNRMRLLLSIAYCEICLENREKAVFYLKQVKDGEDKNYHLSTDDIEDCQIYDAYYVLEEYESFIELSEKVIFDYCQSNRYTYYYALWVTKQYTKFNEAIAKNQQKILSWIEETKVNENYTDEEDRLECIKSYQEDLEILIQMEHKIKNENYKPIEKLNLYPEYGCYLVDCIRHNF